MPMNTREQILHSAQELIQSRGFNAFSFRDIAAQVGIRSASIHHHFPTKEDLGKEVIANYRQALMKGLAAISGSKKQPEAQLQGLIALLAESVKSGKKVCLCAMLMSDSATLDRGMQQQLVKMIEEVEQWLALLLERGKAEKAFSFSGDPAILGRALFAGFQGIMMCVRVHGEPERFSKAAKALAGLLTKN